MVDSLPSTTTSDVALLTQVPLAHLTDGAVVAHQKGKVAFGSRAWEVFRRLDGIRDGLPVDVWINASHAHRGGPPKATWRARYLGHGDAVSGADPRGANFRPPSATDGGEDKANQWANFWEVEDSRQLEPDEAVPPVDPHHFLGPYSTANSTQQASIGPTWRHAFRVELRLPDQLHERYVGPVSHRSHGHILRTLQNDHRFGGRSS